MKNAMNREGWRHANLLMQNSLTPLVVYWSCWCQLAVLLALTIRRVPLLNSTFVRIAVGWNALRKHSKRKQSRSSEALSALELTLMLTVISVLTGFLIPKVLFAM